MTTTEAVTCIITIEIVICIMQCRKYHQNDCNRDPRLIISVKIVTHIFDAEIFTGISAAETSNCIIATETATFITATKRSTNISVAESTTNTIAIEHQNLHNCSRRGTCIITIESVSCVVPTETATCRIDYRNYHLQKW